MSVTEETYLIVQVGSMYLKMGGTVTKDALTLVKRQEDAQRMSMSDHVGALEIASKTGGTVKVLTLTAKIDPFEPPAGPKGKK